MCIRDRLINLASAGHRFANVDLADPNFERIPYDPWVAYGRSKTANVLFAVTFDFRHRDRGGNNSASPPLWKMAIATYLGVVPVIMGVALTLGRLIASWNFVLN